MELSDKQIHKLGSGSEMHNRDEQSAPNNGREMHNRDEQSAPNNGREMHN